MTEGQAEGTVPVAAAAPAARTRGAAVGIAYVGASAVCFGTLPIFARLAYASGVDTSTLLLLRFSIAAVLMWLLLAVRGAAVPRGKGLAMLVGMGAIGYAGQAFSYFTAVRLASAGLAALLLYLYPAIVAVLSRIVFRHRLSRLQVIAVGDGARRQPAHHRAGGGRLGARRALRRPRGAHLLGLHPHRRQAPGRHHGDRLDHGRGDGRRGGLRRAWSWSAARSSPAPRRAGARWSPSPWSARCWRWRSSSRGSSGSGPVRASVYSTLEPATTLVLAAALLGEQVTWLRAAGGALIIAAVVLLARGERDLG